MSKKGTLLTDFGGQDRYLWYNARAWRIAGERLGVKFRLAHFQEDLLGTPLPIEALTVFLWAGMLHADPEMTYEQAEDMLDEDNIVSVIEAFFSRFAGMSPETVGAAAEALGVAAPEGSLEPQT